MRSAKAVANAFGERQSADRNQGVIAAFLERATALTPEESRRSGRALAAAEAKLHSGALDDASRLVATAEAGVLSELEQARAALLHGRISFLTTRSGDAAALLLDRLAVEAGAMPHALSSRPES